MSTELQLVPFRDGSIEAVLHDGRPWCAVRSICAGLGLDVKNQHTKLKTKPWATMVLITTVAADGKQREVLCIDLDSLPMWLATIEPSRTKPAAREALVSYQKEAAKVLRDHFLGQQGQAPAVLLETILQEVRAGQAQRAPERLFTAKQMCAYLQITPRRWRELYLGGDRPRGGPSRGARRASHGGPLMARRALGEPCGPCPRAPRAGRQRLLRHPPRALLLLPRISFTGDGETDSAAAWWFLWGDAVEPRIVVADKAESAGQELLAEVGDLVVRGGLRVPERRFTPQAELLLPGIEPAKKRPRRGAVGG